MPPEIAGALITAVVMLLLYGLDKIDGLERIKNSKRNISGKWHGWMIYLPIEGFRSKDREAIYKVHIDFKQTGRHISFKALITEISDIDGTRLNKPVREFTGKGTMMRDMDVTINLTEKRGLTVGTMYLVLDTWGNELSGVQAVRNPEGQAVPIKVLIRPATGPEPTLEDLGIDQIRSLMQQPDTCTGHSCPQSNELLDRAMKILATSQKWLRSLSALPRPPGMARWRSPPAGGSP